jgi:methyl-accepting chemotaxis protein
MDDTQKIEDAIAAHTRWFARLRDAISDGESDFSPETVRRDDRCEFGRWLYHQFPEGHKDTPVFATIKELHARFHAEAAKTLHCALSGQKEEALSMMQAGRIFKDLSVELVYSMEQLQEEVKRCAAKQQVD